MRVLICGDRNWTNYTSITNAISKLLPEQHVIIEGGASGADTLAKQAARMFGIKVLEFRAEWDRHGLAAGPLRNQQMIDEGKPDIVYAFHADIKNSKGTKDMVTRAVQNGISVIIFKK